MNKNKTKTKLTKKKIISCLAVKHSKKQADVELILDSLFELMQDSFNREEPVMITGFGRFTPKLMDSKQIAGFGGRHRSEEYVKVRFTMSKKMKSKLNAISKKNPKSLVDKFKSLRAE